MQSIRRWVVLAVLLITVGGAARASIGATPHPTSVVLSDENGARAVIYIDEKAAPEDKLAASELATYLEKITGFKFPVVIGYSAPAPAAMKERASTAILIGLVLTDYNAPLTVTEGDDPLRGAGGKWPEASYGITAGNNYICLGSNQPEMRLFAAYDLLERLGCRWYMPGELGEVVPKKRALTLKPFSIVTAPSFAGRHLQSHDSSDPWYKRQRLGGPFFPSAHSSDVLLPTSKYLKDHPEYYALVNGQRTGGQLCYTNEEGTRVATQNMIAYLKTMPAGARWAGIGPNDGGGFCRCENCMKLYYEWDPYSNEWSISDALLSWANKIAEAAIKEVPDAKFGFYIYHTYNLPPVKVKPHPAISGALAPITYCRVHGIRNPVCDEAHSYRRLIEGWGKIMPDLYQRGYGFQLASPQFLWSRVHVWRDEVPYARDHGIVGWRVESPPSWANDPMTHWIFAKLMWNANADVDALIDDFHRNFYGPAAAPSKAFWGLVDKRQHDGDFHTGNAWDEPKFFPPDVMKQLGRHLKDMERAAGPKEGIYARRVRTTRLAYDRAQSFLDMLATFNSGQYIAARAAVARYDALTKELIAYKPSMVQEMMATRYMDIFWRKSVVDAAARAENGKRVLAVLPDAWRARIDPQGVGMLQDWWNDNIIDSGWPTLKTYSASWSDQGLRTYKGTVWYRTTVDLPAKHDGKVMLWFGAIDEAATVWVNGKEIGKKPIRSESDPFEFDITAAVKPGANVVAVRAVNNEVDELGTGGITKPVMVWTGAP